MERTARTLASPSGSWSGIVNAARVTLRMVRSAVGAHYHRAAMSARPHFRLFGIPIRVEPFFWVIAVLFGLHYETIPLILTWVFVVFVSILVHELGHALTLKAFDQRSSIVLHGFGGVTTSARNVGTRARSVAVSLAGSMTGLTLLG